MSRRNPLLGVAALIAMSGGGVFDLPPTQPAPETTPEPEETEARRIGRELQEKYCWTKENPGNHCVICQKPNPRLAREFGICLCYKCYAKEVQNASEV